MPCILYISCNENLYSEIKQYLMLNQFQKRYFYTQKLQLFLTKNSNSNLNIMTSDDSKFTFAFISNGDQQSMVKGDATLPGIIMKLKNIWSHRLTCATNV